MLLVTKAPEQELHELSCVTHYSYILPVVDTIRFWEYVRRNNVLATRESSCSSCSGAFVTSNTSQSYMPFYFCLFHDFFLF